MENARDDPVRGWVYCFADTFRSFVSYGSIKTRSNIIYQLIFSNVMTELTQLFSVILKENRSVTEKTKPSFPLQFVNGFNGGDERSKRNSP